MSDRQSASTDRGMLSIRAQRVIDGAAPALKRDDVVVEEPLEIRIDGDTLAVTMRTPGHDRELVLGFLIAEGVIASTADVASIAHCGRLGAEGRENTIDVKLAPGVQAPVDAETGLLARRGTLTTSACGVCGRRSVADLIERLAPLSLGAGRVAREVLTRAVRQLAAHQPVFARTGGCHAASLLDRCGQVLATYEDVGRHNAVDKAIGARALAGALPCSDQLLVVSGRASFEIVQKAFAAGVPLLASVSAPSSLAIALAERAGITLVGFVRDESMSVYTHPERLVS